MGVRLLLLLPLFASLSSSCSASRQPARDPGTLTIEQALAQLDALSVPAGADRAKFEQLRQSLRTQLEQSGIVRWTAAVPTDAANAVGDLYLTRIDDATATARWTYKNVGDYDQNSQVNISDLSPLGLHLDKNTGSTDWGAARVADGDANGAVSISDLTPLGSHLQNVISGYILEATTTPEVADSWQQVVIADFEDSTVPGGGGLRSFTVSVPAVAGESFRVVALGEGERGVEGVPYSYDGVGGPPQLDPQARWAVLNAVEDKFENGLTAESSADQDLELYNFILSQPGVVDAGAADGFIWGEFSDGRKFGIFKNREPGEMAEPMAAGPGPVPFKLISGRRRASGIPAEGGALLLNSFTAQEPHSSPGAELMQIFEYGTYTPAQLATTIPDLRNLGGDGVGVLYIDGHGGGGRDSLGQDYFAISTAEAASEAKDEEYIGDLIDGAIFPALVGLKDCTAEWRYCFTDSFIDKYGWTFSPDTLVFLNVCHGGDPWNTAMVAAFANAGAQYVTGWDTSVEEHRAYNGAIEFFAIALGDNRYLDVEGQQRSFNYEWTINGMREKGTGAVKIKPKYPPGVDARLVEQRANSFVGSPNGDGGKGLLRPTIEYIHVGELPSENPDEDADSNFDELTIAGNFDPDAQTYVHVGNWVSDPITPVDQYRIKIGINQRLDMSGDVVVEQHSLLSNPVALTEWRGTLHFSEDYHHDDWNGNLSYGVTLHVHFRGALQKYRWKPGVEPDWYTENFPGQLNGTMHLCSDSYAVLADGGDQLTQTFTWTELPENVEHTNTVTISRTVDLDRVDYSNLHYAGTGYFMGGNRLMDLVNGLINLDPWARFPCSYESTATDPPTGGEEQTPPAEAPMLSEVLIASGQAAQDGWDNNYVTSGGENFDLPAGDTGIQTIDNGKHHWYRSWFWEAFTVNGKPNPSVPR